MLLAKNLSVFNPLTETSDFQENVIFHINRELFHDPMDFKSYLMYLRLEIDPFFYKYHFRVFVPTT